MRSRSLQLPPRKPARGWEGRPTTKALELIEQGFTQITAMIEELAQTTGKPPSDLYRRLEKSRKGVVRQSPVGIYIYIILHVTRRRRQPGSVGPLQRTFQTYRSQCYARYKADNENFPGAVGGVPRAGDGNRGDDSVVSVSERLRNMRRSCAT